jgi:hypothetical protein
MARKRLGEILLAAGVLDEARLHAALVEQRRWGGHLGRILVDMKLVSEDVLVQALSRQLNFPAINLDTRKIPEEVTDLIPGELAEQNSLIPFAIEGKFLDVAMTDPTNLGIIDELRIRTQLNVRPYLAGPKMIERALARCYGRGVGVTSPLRAGLADMPYDPQIAGATGDNVVDFGGPGGPTVSIEDAASMSAAQRRAHAAALADTATNVQASIANLQERIAQLEALVQRDENVIRKLMGLLVQKGVASRDEILSSIKT